MTSFKDKALWFEENLPHKAKEYASRNWGHPMHSLCSYQGKLKPSIAHFLITSFTSVGDTILDPLSGAGTIPLEAFLNGRKAIANDLQELGYTLSRAKVSIPSRTRVTEETDQLLEYIHNNWEKQDIECAKSFGFNGKICDFFEEKNLKELLAARSYIKRTSELTVERALVLSALLHILHGNRPYALSRNSHPVTPFKPKGEFTYKDIRVRLFDKLNRVLDSYTELDLLNGQAFKGDFRKLSATNVDFVITSPPFAESTRFYMANWMRLWFAGWEPEDFNTRKVDFLEHQQKKSLDVYKDFYDQCRVWLKPEGKIILHLGKTAKVNMAEELIKILPQDFVLIHSFDEDVKAREKFGIKDQGATTEHQYLFLQRT